MNIHDPTCLKFLKSLALGRNYLKTNRFSHEVSNYINLLSSCSLEIESLSQVFLYCNHFTDIRLTFLDELAKNWYKYSDSESVEVILYGKPKYDVSENSNVRGVLRGGWKQLIPPLKFWRKSLFSLLSNQKLFETPSEIENSVCKKM